MDMLDGPLVGSAAYYIHPRFAKYAAERYLPINLQVDQYLGFLSTVTDDLSLKAYITRKPLIPQYLCGGDSTINHHILPQKHQYMLALALVALFMGTAVIMLSVLLYKQKNKK